MTYQARKTGRWPRRCALTDQVVLMRRFSRMAAIQWEKSSSVWQNKPNFFLRNQAHGFSPPWFSAATNLLLVVVLRRSEVWHVVDRVAAHGPAVGDDASAGPRTASAAMKQACGGSSLLVMSTLDQAKHHRVIAEWPHLALSVAMVSRLALAAPQRNSRANPALRRERRQYAVARYTLDV
jgi:hypothetical protein